MVIMLKMVNGMGQNKTYQKVINDWASLPSELRD